MQAWLEERGQADIAGDACCFSNFQAVADLLNPARYIRTWPMVPAEEIRASAVELQMPTGEKDKANNQTKIGKRTRPMLLHKRTANRCVLDFYLASAVSEEHGS